MAAGARSPLDTVSEPDTDECPEVAVCESRPGTSVFLESGNTDGWIASDVTVDVIR
jgi:hypothetical protein